MSSRALDEAVELLKELISIPSFSREEHDTAALLTRFLESQGCKVDRLGNNVIVRNTYFDPVKETILLNSHHDTVKPNANWTTDPFTPTVEGHQITGLGSNDAGGALVSLIEAFLHFKDLDLSHNIILVASAEEEISGAGGIASVLPNLPPFSFGIVGEPTSLDIAIAEKGLMVLNCEAHGKAGHAAREEGINAIELALPDLQWFFTYRFEKVSDQLGPIKMTPTIIESGSAHNVVPNSCKFTVDVRTTDAYSNEETLKIIKDHVSCEVNPRSLRLQPSSIPGDHPLVRAAVASGSKTYGSPTLSDQSQMSFDTAKIGPGESARSHTANEFILIHEIDAGIKKYIDILTPILSTN